MINTAVQVPQSYGVLPPRPQADRAVLTTDGPFVAVKESLGGIPAIATDLLDSSAASTAEEPRSTS
jgi:hypothetical protein